jgi:hypothetical protein
MSLGAQHTSPNNFYVSIATMLLLTHAYCVLFVNVYIFFSTTSCVIKTNRKTTPVVMSTKNNNPYPSL